MKRLALGIVLLTAAGVAVFLALNRPGAEASPDITITVNSTGDTVTKDDAVLTLREAMMLATGGRSLGDLSYGECEQVSGTLWTGLYGCSSPDPPGAASADTIVFDTATFPGTIELGYTLPALDTGNDTVDASPGTWVERATTITPFDCFQITSDNNTIKGLGIRYCYTGVRIFLGAQDNTIGGTASGEGNIITDSYEDGVQVDGGATTGNTIRGNGIFRNGDKGIENENGGNEELTPPTISGFGSVSGTACAYCTVDIYSDDEDEGEVYEGSTTADSVGYWSFPGWPVGPNATATATDSDGNTSEFSAAVAVPETRPTPAPTPTATGTPPPTPAPTPSPPTPRLLPLPAGWHNGIWSGASTPEEAFACAAGNYAAAYRLVSGGWERYFPDRPDISNMTDLAQYDAFLILVTGDVTCEMSVADPPGSERTLDWGVGWQNEGWSGADDMPPEDAFECAEGSYAAAYRLVGGGWERYFPDRPDISNMGSLDKYDAFLILVTAPVNCTMAIAP